MNRHTAVVTGAANGIGRHFAQTLVRQGFNLVLADIDRERLQAAFSASDSLMLRAHDVASAASWQVLAAEAQARFGRIDYLFNIAGVLTPGHAHEAPLAQIDRHMDVNAKGVMYGTRVIGEIMARQRSGHIVNIASLAGLAPVPGLALYTASKFAVRGYSLTSALELRPHGVFVTVICPDLVDTAMLDTQLRADEAAITFSGSARPLTVEDSTQLLLRAMRERPLELAYPGHRGATAKLVSAFPALALRLLHLFRAKGRRQQAALRQSAGRRGDAR